MSKLTIRMQMLLGFGSLLALLVISVLFSVYQQGKLADLTEKQYKHPFMVTNAVARADGNIVRMSRLMKDIAMVKDDAEIVKLTQQVDALEQKVVDDLTFAKSRYLTSPEEMEKLIQLFKTWKPIRDQVIALKREGKGAEAGELTRTAGGPKLTEIFASSKTIYDIAVKKADSFQEKSIEERAFSLNITLLLGLLTIVVGVLIGLSILRSITRQLGGEPAEVVQIAQQLSVGNFDIVANHQAVDGSVLRAVIQLKDVLQGIILESNQVVKGLAQGRFDGRINGSYAGELETLKVGVNQSAEMVATTMEQLTVLMQGLSDGKFDTRIDCRAEGKFREIANHAMNTMEAMSQVICDINQSMSALKDGDFSLRVTADAKGDLLTMKAAINQTIDSLDFLTNDLVSLANAQLQGDLTQHAKGSFNGRFKSLQDARAASTDKMKEVITSAIEASTVVTEAANQVAQGSADLSNRVQQQAAALEETSATMNQMTSAVQANTANARKVAELTNQVQDQAKDGVQVMQQTISAMQSIKESSSKINDIVSIIDSIAFQTNLLALNAAVEAARAGEHGRGFAVVASEVRALAGKSADAAKDIKTLITDSVSRIESGTQLADKSGEMLNGIAGSIQDVVGMIDEIANASNEQSVGIGQVHLAIADIDRVTQENAALVEETTAAAESMSTEANSLRNSMAFFKTGQQTVHRSNAAPSRSPVRVQSAQPRKSAALPAPKKANSEEWGEF